VVVPDSACEAAESTSDVACFLFDLAGAAPAERAALVSVLAGILQGPGATTVVNSHEVASMLRRSLGVAPANVFDSQVRGPFTSHGQRSSWDGRMHGSKLQGLMHCGAQSCLFTGAVQPPSEQAYT